jgi:glycine/D-amino acid oxidase-like deaminating enzyme
MTGPLIPSAPSALGSGTSPVPPALFDAIVVGGGFYGARLALLLRDRGARVLLVERESMLLARASLLNQARVHNGYHYPRSILTSLRSRMNYERFLAEYADCVDQTFEHFYAIARPMSKVTASQFAEFCRRIGAPAALAPKKIRALFDSSRIDAVFTVQECAFDAVKLRARMEEALATRGVIVSVASEATGCVMRGDHAHVTIRRGDETWTARAPLVINSTYSRLNHLLGDSGAALVPVKHELTELALVEPPPELKDAAVTVMDGPFFSLMPYPSLGLYTLSHVRYTPHYSWNEGVPRSTPALNAAVAEARRRAASRPERREDPRVSHPASHFPHMQRDAERYLPVLRSARYVDSLWEVKTVMPRSEQDDSRPILLRRSEQVPAILSVLGAKIDSVYDVEESLDTMLPAAVSAARVPAHAV